jgi:hypothetical protein
MYLEMVKVCFWLDEWCDTVLKELFPDSFLIVDEKDVFVHSCLDFSEDGRVHSQNLRFVVTFNMNPSSNPQNNEIVITETWYKYLPIEDRTKYLLISQNQNLPMITKIIRITGKSKGMETDSSYYLSLPFHVYKAQT